MKTLLNLCLISLVILTQSCTSIMDPDSNVLKTTLKQVNPRPNIRPASEKDMTVYVRYRNSSGSVLDIRESVLTEVKNSGYKIVDDLDQAQFILTADLRYVGEKASQSYGHTIFGALIGAVAGAVIGHQIGKGATEKVVGAGIGGALGGLAGKAIDNRNRIVTVDMVVDLRIGERIKGGLKTERKANSNSSISSSSSIQGSTGSYERGQSSSNFGESTLVIISEDFLYHENRFIATATKLKLTFGEAQEALSGRIAKAIAGSLP